MIEHVVVTVLPGNRVDRKNAAKALGLSTKTMACWGREGRGPRPFRVGGRVFYRWSDVERFAAGDDAI